MFLKLMNCQKSFTKYDTFFANNHFATKCSVLLEKLYFTVKTIAFIELYQLFLMKLAEYVF